MFSQTLQQKIIFRFVNQKYVSDMNKFDFETEPTKQYAEKTSKNNVYLC